MSKNIEIKVKILGDYQDDPELLDIHTRRLRDELLELDVDSVESIGQTEAPKGSKGVGLAAVGEMILALSPLEYGISSIVGAVKSFSSRNQCNIRVDIGGNSLEMLGTSPEDQKRLIDAFIKNVSE